MDDEQPTTGELLTQWRDATRAAELAERLAEIALQAADQADRSALASDHIARMAEKAAVAAERAARSARQAARQAADLAVENREQRLRVADEELVTARASESHARGRYHEAERADGPPSRVAPLARTISRMTADRIRAALEAATGHYATHPEQARSTDSEARASLVDGLVIEVEGPGGERLTTDMVRSVGGTGSAPSPGWLLRAAEASCVTTLIAMRAAVLGLTLDIVEVTVDFGVRRSRDAGHG